MPRSSKNAKAIEIVDEKGAETFRLLVTEGRVFTFLAGRVARDETDLAEDGEPSEEIDNLAQPDDVADERGKFARHVDTKLQTRLTSKGLQKRLLELFYDSRTLEEEQGVNILYIALGALKWIDPRNASNVRHAPLVLVPVSLERGNAGEKFKLRARAEEFASNLSLEAYLDREHGIRLPVFEATEQFDYIRYAAEVAEAVASKQNWAVLADDITLGFFSFAKFLMYRDLDPSNWPASNRISDKPLIRGLLAEGFDSGNGMIPEDAPIDPFIPPADMLHIVDSDSSQALVVHEVRKGRDMVVQGPPGTGKSQTIANIVASAVADGKTVLFVAEKMAALDVVKRRLDANGVGDACLELHSNKANKRAVLDELRRTWELGAPRGQDPGTLSARLAEARDRLNEHAHRMHTLHEGSSLTPFQAIGHLARLRLDGQEPNEIRLQAPETWSEDGFVDRRNTLAELVKRTEAIGIPAEHPWRGVGLDTILPTEVDRLVARINELSERLDALRADETALAGLLETGPSTHLTNVGNNVMLARRVAGAPDLDANALSSDVWSSPEAIEALVSVGDDYRAARRQLATAFHESAWSTDLVTAIETLADLPTTFTHDDFATASELVRSLPRLMAASGTLAQSIGRVAPTSLADIQHLAHIGDRVSHAPEATAEVFAADLWDSGVERAGDLADAVSRLEATKAMIAGRLSEAAWECDLTEARATLAAHGTGFFRVFSGEWRRANRLVRSFLVNPDQPFDETLKVLDALADGQAARREIERDDALGLTAFGDHWRGPRSSPTPLVAIVEWMRSLKGLGAEPRIAAARRPDRPLVGEHSRSVLEQTEQVGRSVRKLWEALDGSRSLAFGTTVTAERADIEALLAAAVRIDVANLATSAVMTDLPDELGERMVLLGRLRQGREAATRINMSAELGRAAFGTAWSGSASDWN